MTLAIVQTDPQKKPSKIRLESVDPTHIVDCWRLLDRSQREAGQSYPDLSEEQPEMIRSHLFQYLHQRNVVGVLAKIGKKPIGMILGDVQVRPYGRPKVFCFIWAVWVEPEYRKRGVWDQMSQDFFAKLKKAGVHYWEAHSNEALTQTALSQTRFGIKKIHDRIGGKC